ncbi:MAG: PIG-L family deacetylase [Lachnospiraceae bacterium]|nr:PIG-L family deacetylase [Lachnospiraceae bacterium]
MQVLSIKEDDRLLIIAPHPDDECIGPGGVLALYPHLCKVIVLTDGRQGQGDVAPELEKRIRKQEFINEMRMAGISDYEMFDYEDGSLMQYTDCLKCVDLASFTKIFVTGIHDNHPDHTAACISVYQALKMQEVTNVEIYLYEVHAPLQEVTHIMDITKAMEKKLDFIRCHQSQLSSLQYDKMAKSLAQYRALQNRVDGCYYEAYTFMSPVDELDSGTVELEKKLQKSVLFYWILTRWMDLKIRGYGIADILNKLKYNNIAVYGYAELGQLLCKELVDTKVHVSYLLDKRVKDTGIENLPVYVPQSGLPKVDAIVVTAVYYFDEIEKELLQMGYKNIISFRNLLETDDK